LDHGRVKLDALIKILGRLGVVAQEGSHGATQVVGESLVLAKVSEFQSLLERQSGLLVSVRRLLLEALKAVLQLAVARLEVEFDRVVEVCGARLLPEALQVVANEDG